MMNILLGQNPMLRITDEELQKNVKDATTYIESIKKENICTICGRITHSKKKICRYCKGLVGVNNDD